MSNTRTVRTLLQIETDQVAVRRSEAAVSNLRSNLRILAQQAKNADLQIRDAFGRKLAGSIDGSTDALQDMRKELVRVIAEEERLSKIKITPLPAKKVGSTEISGAGRGLTALSRLTGRSSAFGEITALGDDILDVAETLPVLREQFKNIPNAIRETVAAIGTSGAGLIGGLAALGVAVKLYTDETARQKAIADAQIRGLQEYNQLVATSTKKELEAKRETALEALKIAQANADQAQQLRTGLVEGTKQQFGVQLAALEELASSAGLAAGAWQSTKDAVDQTNKDLATAQANFDAIDQALQSGEVAARAAIEAEKELANIRTSDTLKGIQDVSQVLLRVREMAATGTEKQVQARIDSINREIDALQYAQQGALDLAHSLEVGSEANKQASDAANQYGYQIDLLRLEQDRLTGSTIDLVRAHDLELAKIEEEKQIRADSVAAAKQYLDTIKRLEQDNLEARANALAKYNDTLVQIAERAAEAAESALAKLQETQADLARDFARGEADAIKEAQQERADILLEAQRDEARLAREHARKLRDIQIEAQRERERLISERDFAALFDQERRVNEQISDANQAYNDQLEEQRIALQQQLDDQIANYLREREARIQKYQQDLADAQAQYVRELQLADKKRREDLVRAQKAYQEELRLQAAKYTQQLMMAKQTAQAELNLIAQGTQGKLQLEAQYWQVAQTLAVSAINNLRSYGSSGTSLTGYGEYANRAMGGHLNIGQRSRVEAGERFGGVTFPSAGMFTPFRSGMVSVNMTNNITNGTGREAGMMNAFRQIVRQELQSILG